MCSSDLRRLCMSYDGLVRACGYRNLWQPDPTTGVPLAELMRLDTVVVDPSLVKGVSPAAGWSTTTRGRSLVVHHDADYAWPGSRLSWAAPTVRIDSAETVGPQEQRVAISDTGSGGTLVFAMLDWPGYTATLDGRPVKVGATQAGLLTVDLPAGASGTLVVHFAPPKLGIGLAGAGVGTAGALALGVWEWRRRRVTASVRQADGSAAAPPPEVEER